ncbi:putative nuclease HARBI1 [Haliotis rufescens]|uniref:putative nuclease HARBI1 n=1 Tax=Haliotis rufescens TaxID=6454 RepID=UPI00201F757E|nr:putative nuclease HARBI1 [Haliotis rufescens]
MAITNSRKRRSRRRQVITRRLTDRENPLEYMSDDDLFLRFRFRAETILYIVSLVSNRLQRPTQRNSPLPTPTQVLVTLRFLATGGFYSLISDSFSAISAPSVFRSVRDVCISLCSAAYQFVRMPTGSDADTTKQKFHKISGFPNVLGCVDGTFVRIIGPKVNEGDYLNRKGYHSMNVQMICDAEYRFINCVAKWPGSVHESRIFRDSRISVAFENGTYKGFLLGDSAYPCKTYLMTPFLSPASRSQEKYNRCHVRTRVLIEQSFGILSGDFLVYIVALEHHQRGPVKLSQHV